MELKTCLAASDYLTKQFIACSEFYKNPLAITYVSEEEMRELPPTGGSKSYTLIKADGTACCGKRNITHVHINTFIKLNYHPL